MFNQAFQAALEILSDVAFRFQTPDAAIRLEKGDAFLAVHAQEEFAFRLRDLT